MIDMIQFFALSTHGNILSPGVVLYNTKSANLEEITQKRCPLGCMIKAGVISVNNNGTLKSFQCNNLTKQRK